MNAKQGIILVSIGLLLFCVFFIGTASAKTWYVDDDGGPGIDFTNIQDAIDASNEGDTIYVYNGTYYEHIVIRDSKTNLTLFGENKTTTIIDGENLEDDIIRIISQNCSISGFTIKNESADGIYVGAKDPWEEKISNVKIFDNIAQNCQRGISVSNGEYIIIKENLLQDCGISVSASLSSICQNVIIGAGIYITGENTSISGNIIDLEGVPSMDSLGIKVSKGWAMPDEPQVLGNLTISNNLIKNSYIAISLFGLDYNTIRNNTIESSDTGIRTYGSDNNTIVFNSLKNNEQAIDDCGHDNVIAYNSIINNEKGIYANGWDGKIYSNNISNNRIYGISLGVNYTIYNNSILNSYKGIAVEYGGRNIIYHNNLINNKKQAVDESSNNSWDNGPIEGGNYWSDHNCTGNPSSGSQPYIIDEDSIDHYPFEDPNGWLLGKNIFDTCAPANPYPSIMGNHTGTIKPNHTVIATKLYTYPCAGTGGHTKYAKIGNLTWNATATWEGYDAGDWHNITFDKTVVLLANETYNYIIRTGSYPQIIHRATLPTENGWINCTKFTDANGRIYTDWIPAIRLE